MSGHHQPSVGHLIRDWRQLRRLSQLDLALEAEISQKHLSFIESGRSQPSRDMVLLLAENLGVPLRERNALLLAAGFAPVYLERALEDPSLRAAKAAIDLVLKGHEPYPALAIDRHWTLLSANAAVAPIIGLATEAELLRPPVNVLRLSLHPGGLAPHIVNLAEWRGHIVARLRQQIRATADPVLVDLLSELMAYPAPTVPVRNTHALDPEGDPPIVVPLTLRLDDRLLSFISTTTVFGTPVDITLSELALETFFPADAATVEALRSLAASRLETAQKMPEPFFGQPVDGPTPHDAAHSFTERSSPMGSTMDKVKGLANEAAGNVKQAAGKALNKPEMEAEGAAQEAKGEAQQAVGKGKDAVKKVIDKV